MAEKSKKRFAIYLADLDHATTRSHGIVNYGFGLVEAMAELLTEDEEIVALVAPDLGEHASAVEHQKIMPRMLRSGSGASRLLTETLLVSALHRLTRDCDLLHFPKGFVPPWTIPRLPIVVTSHDDIPSRYWSGEFGQRDARSLFFHASYRRTLKAASQIVVSTNYHKAQIGAADNVTVAGVAIDFGVSGSGASDRKAGSLVMFASAAAHKNVARGIDIAEELAASDGLELTLIDPGNVMSGLSSTVARHINCKLSGDEVLALLAESEFLLYPSLYEGFGMPPLEALSRGCRVLYHSAEPVTEVLAGVPGGFDTTLAGAATDAVAAARSWPDVDLADWVMRAQDKYRPEVVASKVLGVYRAISAT